MARERDRSRVKELAREFAERGDPQGFFDALYAEANGDTGRIPWADLEPNPHLVSWLDASRPRGEGQRALVVGCGLGDDAEALAERGFAVTAFDLSPNAIAWVKRRFPETRVDYHAANLLSPPEAWAGAFDFVFEAYTIQSIPAPLHRDAMLSVARFLKPGGQLLVIARGRDDDEPAEGTPTPLGRSELNAFTDAGLQEAAFVDFMDEYENPPARRFRVVYTTQ